MRIRFGPGSDALRRRAAAAGVLSLTVLSGCVGPNPAPSVTSSPQAATVERGALARGKDQIAAQALIGATFYDGMTFTRTSGSDTAEADLSTMPLLGVMGQQRLGGEKIEIGFEGGLIFSWWRDRAEVIATGGGTVLIFVETTAFLTEIPAGLFASTELGRFRFYAGAGPLMKFGWVDVENDLRSGTESEFGVGGYLRGGAEYRLDDGSFLGFGVRGITTNLSFDSAGGEDVEGGEAMLTFTQVF